MSAEYETLSGSAFATLGNEVSDAIHKAMTYGMAADEATSVVVKVALDYGNHAYGTERFAVLKGLIDAIEKAAR